jgi:RNA polymerase sigma-70 factor, ECF subfamily
VIPDDTSLIEKAKRGDAEAFAALVERHQGAVFGYLRSRLLDGSDAEDMTQEAFVRFYLELGRFAGGVPVRLWVIGIARNLLRENLRKVRRRREVAWTRLCLELDEVVEEAGGTESVEEMDEAMAHLPGCLDSLGPNARQAIDLHYGGSQRIAEIARRLHRSEGAVKLLMFRARQTLRQCLRMKTNGKQA